MTKSVRYVTKGILLSDFKVTGQYIPEQGGATYPVLICPQCGLDLLDIRTGDDELPLGDLIAAAQKHRHAHEDGT